MKRTMHLFVLSLTGCLLVASLLSSCTGVHEPMAVPSAGGLHPDISDTEPLPPSPVQVGIASWYGKGFHGRPTASGEIYDMHQPTAAHRKVPLGTHAVVTNLANGQAVRVRINDRGPHKHNRILDLSYEAAQQLNMIHAGLARVKVEFLGASPPLAQLPVMPVDASPARHRVLPGLPTHQVHPVIVQAGASQGQRYALRFFEGCVAHFMSWRS